MPLATHDLTHPDWPELLFFATLLNARIRHAHELRRRAVAVAVVESAPVDVVLDVASTPSIEQVLPNAGATLVA